MRSSLRASVHSQKCQTVLQYVMCGRIAALYSANLAFVGISFRCLITTAAFYTQLSIHSLSHSDKCLLVLTVVIQILFLVRFEQLQVYNFACPMDRLSCRQESILLSFNLLANTLAVYRHYIGLSAVKTAILYQAL